MYPRAPTYFPFLLCVLYALLLRSQFDPDEYYQTLEPALHLLGRQSYVTWEWHNKLRGWLGVFPYYFAYRLGGIAFGPVLVCLVNGAQCATLCVLTGRVHKAVYGGGGERARLLWGGCWFALYCGCRSYSNVQEAILITYMVGEVLRRDNG